MRVSKPDGTQNTDLQRDALLAAGVDDADLCKELGIACQTLYRHVSPTGELREAGHKILTPTILTPIGKK